MKKAEKKKEKKKKAEKENLKKQARLSRETRSNLLLEMENFIREPLSEYEKNRILKRLQTPSKLKFNN